MGDSHDLVSPPDPRCASGAAVEPATALRLANKAAARARRHPNADDARDVAADALVLFLEKKRPLCERSILAAIKHLTRRASRRAALDWAARALARQEEESDLAQASLDAPDGSGPPAERGQPFSRTFADGSTVRLDGALCEADIVDLTLERPDGSVIRGREALDAAHRSLLAERASACGARQVGNARRAVAALSRDALLLSVVGLPWQEALAQLAAHGVHVSRDGLRSGQRAARLRCMGLAAHGTRRGSDTGLTVRDASHRRHIKDEQDEHSQPSR
ncbi:uncharacterized protein SOCE26_031490 [Sorangium cellulosum]|uniref:Uncharacterized protein n=1 Tax=Sorangium cellulosum TaxID=56 RepID=A0A2L0ER07_SORCE|nr:hypothetical protein [Sorangium cellulosum]AUX41726.1 uncharacterized protein SOCE26_031490 [Sorangium cellulosum]